MHRGMEGVSETIKWHAYVSRISDTREYSPDLSYQGLSSYSWQQQIPRVQWLLL